MMAESTSQERSKSSGRTYTDEEWERMKEPFHYFYIEKNLSLKESAKRMAELHGFEATLRQWERRIAPEKWGFTKYTSRDERLAAIRAAGRTLLQVSDRGRRSSTASDGRPPLVEDRNLRRFARREVNRDRSDNPRNDSRRRSKSVGEMSDLSDQDMSGTSAVPSPAPSDMYSIDTHDGINQFPHINHEPGNGIWMQTMPSSTASTMTLPQITIGDVPQIHILGPDDHPSPLLSGSVSAMHGQPQHDLQFVQPPRTQIDTTSFPPFSNQSSDPFGIVQSPTHDFVGHISPHEQATFPSSMSWQNSFVPDANPTVEIFGDLNDISYTQLMALDSHVLDGETIINNQSLENFDGRTSLPQTHAISPLANEVDPLEDPNPNYKDVHALLQEHYNKTMHMISLCIQSCQNASTKDVMMRHLQLLQEGVGAQNIESDRNLRATLIDTASRQQRIYRDVSTRSTNRRRQIEQLEAHIASLGDDPSKLYVMQHLRANN